MNTTLIARLIAAAFAAVTTVSLLLAMAWLGQPGAETQIALAKQPQPTPVVVASSDGY